MEKQEEEEEERRRDGKNKLVRRARAEPFYIFSPRALSPNNFPFFYAPFAPAGTFQDALISPERQQEVHGLVEPRRAE